MSWIEQPDLGQPDLPEIFRSLSLNPEALQGIKSLNETLAFGGSTLTRGQEEAIAVVVSVANRCRYGALTHAGFLRRQVDDKDFVGSLLTDHSQGDLTHADSLMLSFAVRLTKEPASITAEHLGELRSVGFDDGGILSIVLATCLFNFMNRLADGLGVDVPGPFWESLKGWLGSAVASHPWLSQPKGE